MASNTTTTTKLAESGLRYKSKVPGSPFETSSPFSSTTMSCFLCGKHRQRGQLKTRRLLGKPQAVCAPSCKELESILSAEA